MRKRARGALAAAALMVGVAQPARAAWVEAKTEHFIIYGDMSEAKAADYANKVERFDQLLRKVTNISSAKDVPVDRVVVYVMPTVSSVQALAHLSNVAGFYSGSAQDTHAVMPLTMPGEYGMSAQHVLFHEYTHHILLSSTQTNYPSWVQEGLAEFFGTVRVKDDGSLVLGAPPQARGWALHRQYQMTVPELLNSDGRKLNQEEMEDKYARGWLLSHYLLLGKKRPGQFDTYFKLIARGTPSVEAGEQAFGDLRKLNAELDAYNREGKFLTITIPPEKTPVGAVTTRQLRPCEAKIMPTRIRSAIGVTEKTAPELVGPARAVAAQCPNDVFVQRALAEIEFDAKNNDASLAAAEGTLALDPSNIMGMVYKGRVLARQGKWKDARSWFIKANRANPDYALPLELYYDSFMRAGEVPPKAAVNGIYRAIVLVPQDDSLRTRVAYALIRDGDLKTARSVLAPVAYSAHSKADNPALEVVKKIDAGADTKAVLAEANKAKWNEIGKE